MATGQSIGQRFYMLRDNPVGATPLEFDSTNNDCCFVLPVLAETIYSNDLYNDFTSAIFFWNTSFTTAVLKLQKYENGAWGDVATLSGSTYGTAYAFGFWYNMYNQNAIGYKLQWKLVLAALGEGNYRFKCSSTPLFGAAEQIKYSFEYCLKAYTPYRADGTVRIDWKLNGNLGDIEDDTLKRDFGTLDWLNSIRLSDSMFGFDKSPTHEKEYVKYQNGNMKWLNDSQVEEYILKTGRFPNELHRFIKLDILQADEIKVTDYNIDNPTKHMERLVSWNGGYEPNWAFGTLLAPVEISFQQAYQNFNHKRV